MNRFELADSVNKLVERSMPVDVPGDAEYIEATVKACRARFLGTGRKYMISENEQSFERSSVGTMIKGMREELEDGVNYAVMLDILNQRNGEGLDDDFVLRLRQYCETVTCLLVDFDRELQEMLVDLGYVDDGAEYVDTLAGEVNSGLRKHYGWQVIDATFRPANTPDLSKIPIALEAGASVDLDGETQEAYPTPDAPEGLEAVLELHSTGDPDDSESDVVAIARFEDDGGAD